MPAVDSVPTKRRRHRREIYGREVHPVSDSGPVHCSACPVCDGVEAIPTFRIQDVNPLVVRCKGCGLGFFHPMFTSAEIRAFYPNEYYGSPGTKFRSFIERLVRIVGKRHIDFLTRNLSPGARVLDVGCGRGVLLHPLAKRGFEAHGVELSEEAVRGADPRSQIRIVEHLRQARYPDGFFDEIVIWHVLEHLPDPRGTLMECHRILRPGGRIVVALPNFSSWQARWSGTDWFHLDPPRHLYHFPVRALRELLERCGFSCLAIHHFSLRQNPFGWIQSVANRFTKMPRNALFSSFQVSGSNGCGEIDAATRKKAWVFFIATAPMALLLSIVAAVSRSGATIHIVARRNK